jgi:hypothetical protein
MSSIGLWESLSNFEESVAPGEDGDSSPEFSIIDFEDEDDQSGLVDLGDDGNVLPEEGEKQKQQQKDAAWLRRVENWNIDFPSMTGSNGASADGCVFLLVLAKNQFLIKSLNKFLIKSLNKFLIKSINKLN